MFKLLNNIFEINQLIILIKKKKRNKKKEEEFCRLVTEAVKL